MTKLFLITGFLGAGKTTFLQKQLHQMNHKVGVLMNEFGKTSIDGTLVDDEDMEMIELTNGSIFCSCLKDHFVEGLKELINRDLEYIFIESSGLADPSNMLAIVDLLHGQLGDVFSYEGALCLVDALHFKKEYDMMVSVGNQLRHSQVVIINKVDLVDQVVLDEIKAVIKELNDQAAILETTYGDVSFEKLAFKGAIEAEETSNTEDNRPRTITLKVKHRDMDIKSIMSLLEGIKGGCHRIKGILRLRDNTYKIDGVQERLEYHAYDKETETDDKVVLISSIGSKIIQSIQNSVPEQLIGQVDITIE